MNASFMHIRFHGPLCISGFTVYVHIHSHLRPKLDPKIYTKGLLALFSFEKENIFHSFSFFLIQLHIFLLLKKSLLTFSFFLIQLHIFLHKVANIFENEIYLQIWLKLKIYCPKIRLKSNYHNISNSN